MFFDEWGDITTQGMIIIAIIIIILICAWWFSTSSGGENFDGEPRFDNKPSNSDTYPVEPNPVLALYYANWCGHSMNMKSDWDKMVQGLKQMVPNIKVAEFDDDNHPDFIQQSGVKGFPEIRYYPPHQFPRGNYRVYNGDRSAESMLTFATSEGEKQSTYFGPN